MTIDFQLMIAQDSKHFETDSCKTALYLLPLLSERHEVRYRSGCLWIVDLVASHAHELLLELLMRTQCSKSNVPFGGGTRSLASR